jgi:hypothetical protein
MHWPLADPASVQTETSAATVAALFRVVRGELRCRLWLLASANLPDGVSLGPPIDAELPAIDALIRASALPAEVVRDRFPEAYALTSPKRWQPHTRRASGYPAPSALASPPRPPPPKRRLNVLGAGAAHIRIAAVRSSHDDDGDHPEMPNPTMHAVMHVVVENQLAAGEPPEAAATLARLIAAGVSRHAAIHAVASVVAEEMFAVMKGARAYDREAAARRLERLRPTEWSW